MPIHEVYSGEYLCPECERQYIVENAVEDEMVCPRCNIELAVREAEEAQNPKMGGEKLGKAKQSAELGQDEGDDRPRRRRPSR